MKYLLFKPKISEYSSLLLSTIFHYSTSSALGVYSAKEHSLRYNLNSNASWCREVLWQWEFGPASSNVFINDLEERAYTTFVKSEDTTKLGGAAGCGEDRKATEKEPELSDIWAGNN